MSDADMLAKISRSMRPCITMLFVLATAGCAIPIQPIDAKRHEARAAELQARVGQDQEPLVGELDLYGAIARAIKYNLDYRVESMESAVRMADLDLRRFDMLPRLVARIDHNARNNDSGGVSRSLLTGRESLEPSTSTDRNVTGAQLTLSWDILDFGLSYVRARQTADEILIAEERKRKVVNRIVEDVRTAYWRAVGAERVREKLAELEKSTEETLRAARAQETGGLTAPLPALTYQRELLTIRREMQALERELGVAKHQLAALVNLPAGLAYRIAMPERDLSWQPIDLDNETMIRQSLQNRPELREVAYQLRSLDQEQYAAWLRSLPNLRAFLGVDWNSNSFLYNNQWAGAGAQASWNLLNVFRAPLDAARVRAQGELLDQRALALTTAIATQVSVSRARYEQRMRELQTAREAHTVQGRIMNVTQAGFNADRISRQTLVREQMNTLLSEIRYDMALAELQNAFANLHASMGSDAFDETMSSHDDVVTLTAKIRTLWAGRNDALARER